VEIGARVRAARKDAGLTQEGVARRSGLTLKHIGGVERGAVQDPHYSTLAALAHALGTTVAELVGEETAVPLAEAPGRAGQRSSAEGHLTVRRPLEELEEDQVREILKGVIDGRITVETARQLVASAQTESGRG
jgi:transcriptional regulator with XRE-family HTH domain